MKNIISKILNFIALFIRVVIYTVVIALIVIFVIITYQLLVLIFPELFGILTLISIVVGIYALIMWAFLRKKRDTFECPNQNSTFEEFINCGKPYACDACPYFKKENK